jgi:hypothetical protein
MMQSEIYHIGQDDADQLVRALAPGNRTSILMLVIALAIFALLSLLAEQTSLAILLSGVAVVLPTLAMFTHRSVRQSVVQWIDRHSGCASYVHWDQSGLGTGGCQHGEECRWLWHAVRSVRESPDYLILLIGTGSQFIAKAALSPAAAQDLRAQFATHAIPVKAG